MFIIGFRECGLGWVASISRARGGTIFRRSPVSLPITNSVRERRLRMFAIVATVGVVAAMFASRVADAPSAHAVVPLRTPALAGATDIGVSTFWKVEAGGHVFSLEERTPSEGGKHPTIVLFPGTGGFLNPYRRYAESLTNAGFATVTLCWFKEPTPDDNITCPSAPPFRGVTQTVVPALRYVLSAIATLPGVDSKHIGLWGLSRGGGEALLLASDGAKYPVAAVSPLVNPRTKGALPTDADVIARAHGITVPTLLVYGLNDPLVPYRINSLAMANAIRKAGIAPAPRVDGFLGSHDPSGASGRSTPNAAPEASRVLADTILFFHATLGS